MESDLSDEERELEHLSKLHPMNKESEVDNVQARRRSHRMKRLRYDYVLQEKGLETYIRPVSLIKSHTDYFLNKDLANFVLRKIHRKKVRLDLQYR